MFRLPFFNISSLVKSIVRKTPLINRISPYFKTHFSAFGWKYFPGLWGGGWDVISASDFIDNHEEDSADQYLLSGVEEIGLSYEIRSISEIGCAYGLRLFYLHDKCPQVSYYGYDINPKYVELGKIIAEQRLGEYPALNFSQADITDLYGLDKSDIYFTSMMLIYIRPDDIEKVIRFIVSKATSGFVFQELIGKDHQNKVIGYLHDYKNIFNRLNLYKSFVIKFAKIPNPNWDYGSYAGFQILAIRRTT